MTLIEEVTELIKAYRDTKPEASILWLSKRSKVPYSTVRGIAQREVNSARSQTIISILSVFMSQKAIMELLQRHDCDRALRGIYETQKKYDFLPRESEPVQWQYPDHAIIALAATSNGTSRSRISEEFGKQGLSRLDQLLDLGVLREVNLAIKTFTENFTDPDLNSVARQIEIHAAGWKPEQIDAGGFNSIKSSDLSRSAFDQIKTVVRDAVSRIDDIIDSDKGSEKECVMLLNFLCSIYGVKS